MESNIGFVPNHADIYRRFKIVETRFVSSEGKKSKVDKSRQKNTINREKPVSLYEKEGVDAFDMIKQESNILLLRKMIGVVESNLSFPVED